MASDRWCTCHTEKRHLCGGKFQGGKNWDPRMPVVSMTWGKAILPPKIGSLSN